MEHKIIFELIKLQNQFGRYGDDDTYKQGLPLKAVPFSHLTHYNNFRQRVIGEIVE